MSDISKCKNEKCPLKESCYRYTAKDGYWQSYMNFQFDDSKYGTEKCPDYWNNGKCWKCKMENGNHKLSCKL